MEKDLTVLYITANQLPQSFAQFQREVLLEAIGDLPLVAITREDVDLFPGRQHEQVLDTEEKSLSNIYRQMLNALYKVKTSFVATAEDDTLYHRYHFEWRPEADTFYYDQNRFALFTWGEPMYSWRNRRSNCSLIAPTALLIEALEERFEIWPNGTPEHLTGEVGRERIENGLGLTIRKSKDVYSKVSVIQFNHDFSSEERQRTHRKSYGPIRAYNLFYWGDAGDLRSHFK